MKNRIKLLSAAVTGMLITGAFFSSCYYDNREELYGNISCDTTDMSYSADILPILDGNCLTCHSSVSAGTLGGGNDLEGFDNLMGYVTPGDPENSVFYQSIAWIPGTSFMPQGGDKLSDCDIAKVRSWILNGAANN